MDDTTTMNNNVAHVSRVGRIYFFGILTPFECHQFMSFGPVDIISTIDLNPVLVKEKNVILTLDYDNKQINWSQVLHSCPFSVEIAQYD
jgi:hypothetical protein